MKLSRTIRRVKKRDVVCKFPPMAYENRELGFTRLPSTTAGHPL